MDVPRARDAAWTWAEGRGSVARRGSVELRIQAAPGHLSVEVTGRQTPEENRAGVWAVLAACREHHLSRILVNVRESRAIFRVGQWEISSFFADLASLPGARMALVADTVEVHSSHQYIETLARQRGLEVRAFRGEPAALRWLLERSI